MTIIVVTKKNSNINKVIALYQNTGWKKRFSRIRIWEAPCWEVEKLIPTKGLILDLGCGEGINTNLWALAAKSRKIIGIDQDRKRISQADRGLGNTTFRYGNILTARYPKCDAIVIFHVLHHLNSFMDQETLIKKSYRALNKKGKLIIVEVDIKLTFKYLISWLTDHFVAPILFEGSLYEPRINYRRRRDWLALLKKVGFKTHAFEVERNKPFTNLVIECVK